jgi:hypothetical protein
LPEVFQGILGVALLEFRVPGGDPGNGSRQRGMPLGVASHGDAADASHAIEIEAEGT